MEYKDYYKILGVDRNADEQEIKRAYRKLALKFHPDRNPGNKQAEEQFKEINEAYQVLGDKEKRGRYDQLGESYSRWQQTGGQPGGFNWSDWTTTGQGGQGGQRVTIDDLNEMFGGGFSDFFSQIFGGMGGAGRGGQTTTGRRARRAAPRDAQQDIKISFDQAYHGTAVLLQTGERRLEVKIPAGARTGTRIRVPGGAPAGPDGAGGDLYLVVEVTGDQRFERQGDNLYTDVSIDLFTAVLGGQVTVPTPAGNVSLTIPAGTQPGQTIRLAGRGMPILRGSGQFGDLFARIKVALPRQLSAQQKALFEQLRGTQ